ncbi:hypothetical protein AB0J83_12730 [Actinoplanes sp. NPDC049596]|uniref:hypothetical protein n=1 Tax=unclassified Actinoplanes TaxID=2626549 RepID=UPI00343FD01B
MDQREWDYGARMSRDRRAADSWATRSPDSPDFAEPEQKWSSLTDTGSMQPSAEALDWQRRADAWAQQAESDQSQSVEPASRWSEVASTGRTTFPADGVGWRTETAEWRATGARWKQTTEWRSTTGSHGWRSTTEAWQSGGRRDYPPAAETPASQPAISSSAWSATEDEPSPATDTRPSWQQFTEPDTTYSRQDPPSWRDSSTWQQPSPRTPAESSPSWRRDAIEGSATWNDTGSTTDASWLRTDNSRDDGRHLVREDDRAAWRRGAQQTPGPIGRRRAPEPGPSGGSGWSTGRSESDSWDADNWAGHADTGNIQLYGDPGASTTSSWRSEPSERSEERTGRRSFSPESSPYESRSFETKPYETEPGYQIPPATAYESTRPARYDDTAGAPALPPGRYDEPRGYAQDTGEPRGYAQDTGEPRGYAQDTPAPRSRRERGPRYADDDTPGRSGAAPTSGLAGPPTGYPQETRSARRARAAQPIDRDETSTFGAAPTAYPEQASSPWPAAPPSGIPQQDRTPPARPQPGPSPADPRRGEPRPGAAPKARYNPGSADWREQTGSWEAEPDTSSWTRDPDTGQWSRSEDDPRILAWRREAARREAMGEAPRAITAGPAEQAQEQPVRRPEPEPPARRTPPALPPAPAPRSGTPYGTYGEAPARPSYPVSPEPGRPSYPDSPEPGRPSYPDSPEPGRPSYLDSPPTGRGYPDSPPTGRGYPDSPPTGRGYPDEASPGRRSYDDPAAAPRSGTPYSGGGYGSSAGPRSAPPSSAPRSAPSYGATPTGGYPDGPAGYPGGPTGYPSPDREPGPPRYSSANPASGLPRYSASAPASGLPADTSRYSPSAPASGLPADTPRYSASAPASGLPTGAPRYSPTDDLGGETRRFPAEPPRYSASAPASGLPSSGQPAIAPRYSSATPASGLPAAETPGAPQYGAGRRRADDQEPPTRRGELDPTAYAQEPLSPDAWRRDSPQGDAPPWSPGGTTEIRQRPEPGAWHLAEREERARGSASYREGGGNDWRRDLADQSDLAEGESRRYGTSDYVPFRSSGSAAVEGTSNLSMTSTSLISPVPREQREAVAAGYPGLSGSYERRPVTGGYPTIRPKSDLLDPDDEEDEQEAGGPLAAVGYTLLWYGVPVVLFVVYMVVFGAGTQTHALDTLGKAAPQFGISLVLSVLVAVGLRWISHSWKAISVGLAAAVVGGGLATVLTSAITGNSLS